MRQAWLGLIALAASCNVTPAFAGQFQWPGTYVIVAGLPGSVTVSGSVTANIPAAGVSASILTVEPDVIVPVAPRPTATWFVTNTDATPLHVVPTPSATAAVHPETGFLWPIGINTGGGALSGQPGGTVYTDGAGATKAGVAVLSVGAANSVSFYSFSIGVGNSGGATITIPSGCNQYTLRLSMEESPTDYAWSGKVSAQNALTLKECSIGMGVADVHDNLNLGATTIYLAVGGSRALRGQISFTTIR